MPTYEYACQQCGHHLEQFQSITAKPLKRCPGCGKNALQRLIGTGAGIIFKGSGFYATDYRSDSYTQAKKKEEGTGTTTAKEGGESTAKKTESKESTGTTTSSSTATATEAPATKPTGSKTKR